MFAMHFRIKDTSCVNAEKFRMLMDWVKEKKFVSYKQDAYFYGIAYSDGCWSRDIYDKTKEQYLFDLLKSEAFSGVSLCIKHAAGYGGEHIKNKTTDLIREVQEAAVSFADERGHSILLDIYGTLNIGWALCEEEENPIFAVSLSGDGYWSDGDEFPSYALGKCPLLSELLTKFEATFAGKVVATMDYDG